MVGPRFTLRKGEIMILFNRLIQSGYDRNLRISVPLLAGMPLFKLHLNAETVRLDDFCAARAYEKQYSKIMGKLSGKVKREIPRFDHVRAALYQSGILGYEGIDRLEEILSFLRKQDVLRGGDVYYIALDTNTLRDRFFSVYLKNIPPHANLDFVLCETVRAELKNRQDKLSRNVFRDNYFNRPEIPTACFINQNFLQDRMRYVGFLEYNRMRSATSCEEIEAGSRHSGMLNDQIILKSYSEFVDIARKVVFISRDHEAVRMMTGEENVIPILLEQKPMTRADLEVPWSQFFELLYLLGVLFGRLALSVGGIEVATLDGVWRRKDVAEWEEDMIRLTVLKPDAGDKTEMEEYSLLRESLGRNTSALRRLEEAGMF